MILDIFLDGRLQPKAGVTAYSVEEGWLERIKRGPWSLPIMEAGAYVIERVHGEVRVEEIDPVAKR